MLHFSWQFLILSSWGSGALGQGFKDGKHQRFHIFHYTMPGVVGPWLLSHKPPLSLFMRICITLKCEFLTYPWFAWVQFNKVFSCERKALGLCSYVPTCLYGGGVVTPTEFANNCNIVGYVAEEICLSYYLVKWSRHLPLRKAIKHIHICLYDVGVANRWEA